MFTPYRSASVLLAAVVGVGLSANLAHAEVLLHEDFETDGNGTIGIGARIVVPGTGTRYEAPEEYHDYNNFWTRMTNDLDGDGTQESKYPAPSLDPTVPVNMESEVPFSGYGGNHFWQAMNVERQAHRVVTITFNPIDTFGYENLQFSGLFGGQNPHKPTTPNMEHMGYSTVGAALDLDGDGDVDQAAPSDYLNVNVSIDGGDYQTILALRPAAESDAAGIAYRFGVDADGDGVSDADKLLAKRLTELTAEIPEGGMVQLQIETFLDKTDNRGNLAFDDLKVTGTKTVPESASLALLGVVGAVILRRRWVAAE